MGVDGRDEPRGSEEAGSPRSRRMSGRGSPDSPSVPQQREGGQGILADSAQAPGSDAWAGRARPSHARRSGSRSSRARSSGTPPADAQPSGPRGSDASGAGVPDALADERTVVEEPAVDVPPSDIELVARMRSGESVAYEELYRRHAAAVRRYARSCCRDDHTAEDLTNEVFASTLQAVRGGAGPNSAVRAYLLTTVRRVAAAWAKTTRREQLIEDFAVFAASAGRGSLASDDDTLDLGADVLAMREAEQSLAVQAFRSLPERWQTVLWHTTVEEESPSEVAPLLGLTANATAVLAHRAREGLKQAYLQAHVSTSLTSGGTCARYADRLGAYARGGLRMRAERGLRKHLEDCARCRTAALEVADVNARLRALLPVAVIGWSAAGFSVKVAAGLAAGTAGAGTAAGAGVAATAGSGGGGGAGGGAGSAAAGEGLGAPAKAGIAAGAVIVAGAVTAYALMGSSPAHHLAPRAKAPAGPVATVPPAAPEPEPVRKPPPSPPAPTAPVAPVASVRHTTPPPTPRPVTPPPPAPSPTPSAPESPAPSPDPTPSQEPPVRVFPLNQLEYGGVGDGTEPEVRLSGSGWLWQRYGMEIGGVGYGDGVSMRASSSVTVDLNRSCTSYDALVGVDDLTFGLGAARFSVYGDGTRLWESGVVRAGEAAVPVHVPLSGYRTVRLVVSPVSVMDSVTVADWARARISCA
ncbi:sigma-70 family RNA polymerase sigma factor [Streptomyces sp. NPDC020379]|uniref:sigma-70 family RNA polymerase sigma factor n=1 Tax=Streptomyces sp. NPDC020379 TaxID=3365071 RepID=UPI0037B903B6